MAGGKPAKTVKIEMHRWSACPKVRARSCRIADAELRYHQVVLPATPLVADADPVTLSAVHVKEIAPPEDEKAMEWYLLTSSYGAVGARGGAGIEVLPEAAAG